MSPNGRDVKRYAFARRQRERIRELEAALQAEHEVQERGARALADALAELAEMKQRSDAHLSEVERVLAEIDAGSWSGCVAWAAQRAARARAGGAAAKSDAKRVPRARTERSP